MWATGINVGTPDTSHFERPCFVLLSYFFLFFDFNCSQFCEKKNIYIKYLKIFLGNVRYIKMINLFLLRDKRSHLKVCLIFGLQIIKFPGTKETYNVTCILDDSCGKSTQHVQQVYGKGRAGCVNSEGRG